jgi:hypothetical protein
MARQQAFAMNRRYARVAQRAGHRCEYCRAPEVIFNFPFEVEHILPPMRGGADEDENLALACRACNVYKGEHASAEDPLSGNSARLFDPRRDSWDEHFIVELQSSELRGLTPIGRATVVRLNMNALVRLEARRLWMRLGLFP